MNGSTILALFATGFSALLAIASLLRALVSKTYLFFFAGMTMLAVESAFSALSLRAGSPGGALRWQSAAVIVRSFMPAVWLLFSLTYSRGNYREFLVRWRILLMAACVAPIILTEGFQEELFRSAQNVDGTWALALAPAGRWLCLFFLVGMVLALTNLEKTFRTAVGTMRWRIKFVVLGLCVIFGAKLYVASQTLLYSGLNLSLSAIESGALVIGCSLIAVSYLRAGRLETDVYPSHTFLYSSITLMLTGVYLFIVGVLANVVIALGEYNSFSAKALLILVGVVGLAVILLSDRVKQATHRFVSRHLKRPLYDSRKIWSQFTENTAHATDQTSLCAATTKLISDTFDILSATIWLSDETEKRLALVASTAMQSERNAGLEKSTIESEHFFNSLCNTPSPFDLEESKEPWAEDLRRANPVNFKTSGHRIGVPIIAGDRALGLIVLGDRVRAVPFTDEELDLLRCIGNHVAASLLTIQLSQKLMEAKEQEAVRAVSAFFAHDLKNSVSTLSLMLQNLPKHFDDPAFRADVLRGISKTVGHMNHLISRLTVLRQKPNLNAVLSDLNEVVDHTLNHWQAVPEIALVKEFQPLPQLSLDREQIQNVVTNLLLNARDAINRSGQVCVKTHQQNGWAVLSVSDNGCGMSQEFLRQSLFRPFQTTKKEGTGIGMFQCKMIVEAHQGKIEVESEMGKGSSFHVMLPLSKQN
jgi:putative PEP-CTERM system histidine kinase